MARSEKLRLSTPIWVNDHRINWILIGDHYREKHLSSVDDRLIVSLVMALSGGFFLADSSSQGVEYFATDIEMSSILGKIRTYRLIWLIEGGGLDVIGVVNAYRTNAKRK